MIFTYNDSICFKTLAQNSTTTTTTTTTVSTTTTTKSNVTTTTVSTTTTTKSNVTTVSTTTIKSNSTTTGATTTTATATTTTPAVDLPLTPSPPCYFVFNITNAFLASLLNQRCLNIFSPKVSTVFNIRKMNEHAKTFYR